MDPDPDAADGAVPTAAEATPRPELGLTPDPGLPPEALVPEYELPSARQVVGRGLQLALDGSADIRRASLYIGLLVAAVAAPAAVLLIANLPTLIGIPWDDPTLITPDQSRTVAALFGPLYGAAALASLGIIAVLVDGQLIAVSLLAGRLAGSPLTLREALARSRQVFWRYGAAAFAVGLLSTATNLVVGLLTGTFWRGGSLGASLLGTLLATIATAPFAYVLMGVVAGDVSSGTALRRSLTLARARPLLAAAVAAFAFLASAFTVLGISAAVAIASDIGLVIPEIKNDTAAILIAIPIVAAALVAYGSLSVTVAAITVAPQVTAFLGLTHYATGLERARSQQPIEPAGATWTTPPAIRPARWVTIPMALLIGLEAIVAFGGLSSPGSTAPGAPGISGQSRPSPLSPRPTIDPVRATIADILQGATEHHVGQIGAREVMSDRLGDETGSWPQADLASVQDADTDDIPGWLLAETFACDRLDVACGVQRDFAAFDDGAFLFAFRMTLDRPRLGPRDIGEWAALFALPEADVGPASEEYPGASVVFTARWTPTGRAMRASTWNGHEFKEGATRARARWFGETLIVLVPFTEIKFSPQRCDALVDVTLLRSGSEFSARDWLHGPDASLVRCGSGPIITFGQ